VAFVSRRSLDPNWEQALNLAIDARNDAVHGGITLPSSSALRHIRAVGIFLDEQHLALSHVAPPGRPRILDAFAEATATAPPQSLERVVDQFFVPHGLDAILYSDSATRPKGPAAYEYGRAIVVWLPLHDPSMTPERLALRLARIAIEFSLRYQGRTPRGKVGDLPFDDWSEGFAAVAWELTRAVWEIGIDRVLEAEGMGAAISSDIDDRATALRRRFSRPYEKSPPRSVLGYTVHAELARVSAVVTRNRQDRLIAHVAQVDADVADRARGCLQLLAGVNLEDHASIRDALICLHDRSPMLLASVVVLEPETGALFGNGLASGPSTEVANRPR
jgi:hypothetical protein